MKRWMVPALLFLATAISACSSARESIKEKNVGIRGDVFEELTEKTPVPKGHADLRILTSLKMHTPGYYLLDDESHGTADYMLLINIDGQAVRVKAILEKEPGQSGIPKTPETGEGIRYLFRKDLRLKAGAHTVFVAFPEDDIAVEKEITLKDGSDNILELSPVYRSAKKTGIGNPVYIEGDPTFYKGIRKLVVILNGCVL